MLLPSFKHFNNCQIILWLRPILHMILLYCMIKQYLLLHLCNASTPFLPFFDFLCSNYKSGIITRIMSHNILTHIFYYGFIPTKDSPTLLQTCFLIFYYLFNSSSFSSQMKYSFLWEIPLNCWFISYCFILYFHKNGFLYFNNV